MGHIKLFQSAEDEQLIEFLTTPDGNLFISILNEDYETERFFVMIESDIDDLIKELKRLKKLHK